MSDVARDYPLDEQIDANSPERLKALGDRLRMQLLDLVLERAMSVSELAEVVDRPKGTVAYHVDVLVDAGLLKVVRTQKVRAVEERFYGRVARTIVLPGVPGELPFLRDVLADVDTAAMAGNTHTAPAMFTYRHARVPADRVAEYAERLHALALEFIDEPRGGDVDFGLYVGLFPTNRRVSTHRAALPADEDE